MSDTRETSEEMNTETPKQKPILIYIAGPYRAPTTFEVEENIHRAKQVGAQVLAAAKELGVIAYPVIPHANTAHFDGLASDELFLEGTLELMRRCDGVLLVEGWESSEGASGEHDEASSIGMPIEQVAWSYGYAVASLLIRRVAAVTGRKGAPAVTGTFGEEHPHLATTEKVDAVAQVAAEFHELAGEHIRENEKRIEDLTSKVDGHREMCIEELAEAKARLREDMAEGIEQETRRRNGDIDRVYDSITRVANNRDRMVKDINQRIDDIHTSAGINFTAHREALDAEIRAIKQRLDVLTAQTAT